MAEEIERVFLLDRLPELPPQAEAWRIEQGYLPDPPAGSQPGTYYEGRVRRKVSPGGKESFIHTIKSGQGLVREEVERDLEPSEFAQGWDQTLGRRICKTRHKVAQDGVVWEIDAFDEFPLVMAEVELESAEQTVELPEWLAPRVVRELTEDPRYRNYALATVGLPPDHAS